MACQACIAAAWPCFRPSTQLPGCQKYSNAPCSSACDPAAHRGGPALLARALRAWAVYLQREADEKGPDFNGRPFFRVAVACIQELTPSSRTDAEGLSYLATIAGALLDVQPLRAPAFTFPWLELVSHR